MIGNNRKSIEETTKNAFEQSKRARDHRKTLLFYRLLIQRATKSNKEFLCVSTMTRIFSSNAEYASHLFNLLRTPAFNNRFVVE